MHVTNAKIKKTINKSDVLGFMFSPGGNACNAYPRILVLLWLFLENYSLDIIFPFDSSIKLKKYVLLLYFWNPGVEKLFSYFTLVKAVAITAVEKVVICLYVKSRMKNVWRT